MDPQQLSLFDQPSQKSQKPATTKTDNSRYENQTNNISDISMLVSALSAKVSIENNSDTIKALSYYPEASAIAHALDDSRLVRQLRIQRNHDQDRPQLKELIIKGERFFYESQDIGKIQLLYKSPLPGERQARLAYESIIDRFLEYLQKEYKMIILHESDYHVQIFMPKTQENHDLGVLWKNFLSNIAFSVKGNFQQNQHNLIQTFILMLKSITLAGRGFSTLEVPIITQDQAIVLASLYLGVWEQVKKRQGDRGKKIKRINQFIEGLNQELENVELSDKDRKDKDKELQSKEKELEKDQEMQKKEANKYQEYFNKTIAKILQQQQNDWNEIQKLEQELSQTGLKKAQINKLQKQKNKLQSQIFFSLESIAEKQRLLIESKGDPFEFIQLDREQNLDKFKGIIQLSKLFNKTATEQINSTRGDIFTQCILEMYRLLEITKFDAIPESLLTTHPKPLEMRTAGDDGKDFCYSCGVALDEKNAQWRVARFMFERPSQRRQSSSSEDRPFICACCSVLSFASPLKVTDDSVILRLEYKRNKQASKLKIKEYLRMLTNKDIHLCSGRYIVLTSDKTSKGDLASEKLGQVQYALGKVSSIFPLDIISDFDFILQLQGTEKDLLSRHLIFIKGLMEGYSQSLIISGQEINVKLGDAIRYVQQDLPYLAEYTILKTIDYNLEFKDKIMMENIREIYWKMINKDLDNQQTLQGDSLMSQTQLSKRAKIYEDVAALTGLLYPFIEYAEYLIKKDKQAEEKRKQGKQEQDNLDPATIEKIKKDVAREVSKIIENVKDEHFFTYYASIGDQNRTKITATLKRDRDTYFIYDQAKKLLLDKLNISELKEKEENGDFCLNLTLADIENAFHYFACDPLYSDRQGDKNWNDLTYRLKLSLYTRFPELVRKLSSKGDN